MDRHLELLSPAGSWEALVAAVQNGADAVYMGGTRFNARRYADNFDDEMLRRAVEYAHLYGVRIYITVNILIKEKELDELSTYLDMLEKCAVDGIIVQDLGAARMIADLHPNLALHASTQMTIHNLEGAKVLEDLGFTRIVPARELTLEEINHIKRNSRLDIETFIHGAMCVSYSGQCLMSSMIGGRSGNRGMCAQPCRLPYTLNKDQNQNAYHISMKDMSTIEFIEEIAAAGVTSFKIEGRMKRPEYVAVVTREYRRALDSIISTGHYRPDKAVYEELEQIFNRGGFSKGYYYDTDHKNLTAREKPNNWGVYLGKVAKTGNNKVWIALEQDIEVGDGIEYWTQDGTGKGQTVSSIVHKGRNVDMAVKGQTVGIKSSIKPDIGMSVYRTSRASQLKKAESSFANRFGRKIPVTASARFITGSNPYLELTDEEGNRGISEIDYQIQPALKKAVSRHDIEEQLNKLGDTPFVIESLTLECSDNLFIPVSIINQLRRDAAQNLIDQRTRYFYEFALLRHRGHGGGHGHGGQFSTIHTEPSSGRKPEPLRGQFSTTSTNLPPVKPTALQEQFSTTNTDLPPIRLAAVPALCGYLDRLDIDPVYLAGLDEVCFAPRDFTFKTDVLGKNIALLHEAGMRVRLVLPRITRMDDMALLRKLPDDIWTLFDVYQAGNIGQTLLLREKGISSYWGDYGLNVMNSRTAELLREIGFNGIVLSPELTTGEIHDIIQRSSLPCEILVYGRLTLMTLEYCPNAASRDSCANCRFMGESTFTDRKGYEFPLIKRRILRCYTELLNSQPVFLADDMSAIHRTKAAAWGLKLEGLTPDDVHTTIKLYRHALDHSGTGLPDDLARLAEDIKGKGFTRGHFFRGVE